MEDIIRKIVRFFKGLSYTSCLTLFLTSLWILVQKNIDQCTGISVEFVREKEIQLPALTFCSEEPFKSNGYHHKEKEFLENTFEVSDIFGPKSIDDFKHHPDEVSNFYQICASFKIISYTSVAQE